MRNAKLIVPVLVVIVGAALIGALAPRSGDTSNRSTLVKTW